MSTTAQREPAARPAPHKPKRPNPARLYPPPAEWPRMWLGISAMRAEVRGMTTPALSWDLRRVRRARAAFRRAELEDGFDGSKRNPVLSWESSYPFLHSDFLRERQWAILRELREREAAGTGPRPADVYPVPPQGSAVYLGGDRAEVAGMDLEEVRQELVRIHRALALFTPAERASEYGTPEFDGSARNPVLCRTESYPYLFSDYLNDREMLVQSRIRQLCGADGEEA